MPAAAVIPAPIVYIKVVAVKKLVVGFWDSNGPVCRDGVYWPFGSSSAGQFRSALYWVGRGLRLFYFEKIRVFKAGLTLCH